MLCAKAGIISLFAGVLKAHEMTPTYFKFRHSASKQIYQTSLSLFNRREDQQFYQVSVYDKDFNHIPFASKTRLIKLKVHTKQKFTVFIKKEDLDDVVYICTESKTPKGQLESTGITSRICSKRKE